MKTIGPLALIFILGISAHLYRNGARIEVEHNVTIPHYLSDRSLPAKVFDIAGTEAPSSPENFQARELSYFFDYLDLQIIVASGKLGYPIFLSGIKYLFVALIAFGMYYFLLHDLRLGPTLSFLCVALFVTTPAVFHYPYFHRTAKVGVAVGIVFYLITLYRRFTRLQSRYRAALFFGLIWICYFDSQGFYIASCATLMLGGAALGFRERRFVEPFLIALIAVLTHAVYRRYAGILLIERGFGYRIVAPFGHMTLSNILSHRRGTHFYLVDVALLVDYFRFFLGSIPRYPAAGVLVAMVSLPFWPKGRSRYLIAQGICFGLSLVALAVMIHVMGIKLDQIFLPPIRLIAYGLPSTALLLFGLGLTLHRLLTLYPARRSWVVAGLALLALRNIYCLPAYGRYLERYGQGTSARAEYAMDHLRRAKLEKEADLPPELRSSPAFLALRRSMVGSH